MDLMLQVGIALLAFWAVWKSIPNPPSLEWKYFHSLMLSTLMRGALEKQEASVTEWKNKILQTIGYHPENPGTSEIFCEQDSPRERWRYFFQDDSVITDTLLRDPEELGRPFKPAALVSWEDIAQENDSVFEYLKRKLSHVIVAGNNLSSQNLAGMIGAPHFSEALDIEKLSEIIERKDQRFLFVGEQKEVEKHLQVLRDFPALRDRTLAVLMIDPTLDMDWLEKNFTQEHMDAEANVAIPYITWSYVDLDVLQPWTTVVEPEIPDSGWKSIDVIDLGAFPNAMKNHQKWMNLAVCFVLCKRMEMV